MKLLGKSGNLRPIMYYDSRGLLYNMYKQLYPEIRAIAEESGVALHDTPRSYKVHFNQIIAQPKHRFYPSVILSGATCVTATKVRASTYNYQTSSEGWQLQGCKTSWRTLFGT